MSSILCRFGLLSRVPLESESLFARHELTCRRGCGARWAPVMGPGFAGTVRLADAPVPGSR